MKGEEDGCMEYPSSRRVSQPDLRHLPSRDGAGAPGGPAKAEPGAGSAGPGAAQRRRLDLRTAKFGNANQERKQEWERCVRLATLSCPA